MRFLVDAQLPPALACWLREAGHEAEHVEDVSLREADDGAIWAHALQSGAIIVTKDEDFAARSAQAATAPTIVWLRVGNGPTRVIEALLRTRAADVLAFIADPAASLLELP